MKQQFLVFVIFYIACVTCSFMHKNNLSTDVLVTFVQKQKQIVDNKSIFALNLSPLNIKSTKSLKQLHKHPSKHRL